MSISNIGSSSSNQIIVTVAKSSLSETMALGDARLAEYGRVDSTQQSALTRVDVYQRQGFQTEYTKEDALLNLWKKEHSLNINDTSSWGKFAINPTQQDLGTLLSQLESNGLSGEVDWGSFCDELDSFKIVTSSDLADSLDYISSRYVAIIDKLERNFFGDELLVQKEKLNTVFEKGVSNITEGYAKKIETQIGLSANETQKIQDSLQSILNQKIQAYQSTLGEVEELSNESESWLQNHDTYIAAQLRQSGATIVQDSEMTGLYTLQDLTVVGKVTEQYQEEINSAANGNRNEVTLALNMAMIDMKVEKLAQKGYISDDMAQLLHNAREKVQQTALNGADEKLESRRSNALSGEVIKSFTSMDRGMFSNIYHKVMDTYNITEGDATQAIYQGAKYGKTLTSKANTENATVSRWGLSMKNYWEDFYKSKQASGLQKTVNEMFGLTSKDTSTFQNYSDSWQHFIATLSSDESSWYMGAEGSTVPDYGMDTIWIDVEA